MSSHVGPKPKRPLVRNGALSPLATPQIKIDDSENEMPLSESPEETPRDSLCVSLSLNLSL